MNINREELVTVLEGVIPGTETKEIIEQSTCFVFKEGNVYTYNEDVSCCAPLPGKNTKEIEGAVRAKSLLDLLKGMQQDVIDIDLTDSEMLIRGKGKEKAGLRMERDIALPIHTVEKAKNWKPLHVDFIDAVGLVKDCAGTDNTKFNQTCIHIHPKWIEACDGMQISRYLLKTRVEEPLLVRQANLSHIVTRAGMPRMVEFDITSKWIHFRNASNLVLSCRYHKDKYPDMTKHLDVSGEQTSLPKNLGDVIERAKIFAQENANSKLVRVNLEPNRITIRSEGPSGWYEKPRSVQYDGPSISFMIAPQLLADLSQRYNDCEISESRLIVKDEKWKYVACLGKVAPPVEANGHVPRDAEGKKKVKKEKVS